MAQTGYTPILIYASGTASNVPSASNLTSSASGAELALNYADGKLYYKDSGGTVQILAGKGGTGIVAGSNTQVQFNNNGVFGASSSLTWASNTLTTQNLALTGNVTSNLLFTDNTYDIGASGATRPRNLFASGSITLGPGGTSSSVLTQLLLNGSSASTSYNGIRASRNSTNYWFIGDNEAVGASAGLVNYLYGANPWSVSIAGTTAILANGAATGVGIFQTNPSARLHVFGNASTTVTGLLVESSGTLASNEIIRFSIVGLTNGFRMRQDSSSALKYSFEGGKVGINMTAPLSELEINGNITLDAGGLLNNLYYDGNWRYSQNNAGIGWALAGDSNQVYFSTSPASGTQGALATVTTRVGVQSNGLLSVYTGPAWIAGGFSGVTGKQLNLGYDVANSIGYVRSANNGVTGTPLYLDGSEVRVNIGTTTSSQMASFTAGNLTFAASTNITTASGYYLNINPAGALILDAAGSGANITFRRASSDVGFFTSNGLVVSSTATSATSKLTVIGGNVSIGGGAGYLYNTYYDGAWKFVENGWGGGEYLDGAGTWNFFLSSATNSSGAGAGATVNNVLSTAYNKSLALQNATTQTGTGITFPASQSPSTNANTLDDYEEGSFTPAWGSTGTSPTISYSEQSGVYIKIGRMVYYRFRLVVNSASGGSGNLQFTGLPFTSVNNGNAGFTSLNFSYGWGGANAVLDMIHTGNSTTLDCYTQYAAYNGNTQCPVSALTAGGTVYLIGGGCYESAV